MNQIFAALAAAAFMPLAANAATVTKEVFAFEATLSGGQAFCGFFPGVETSCPEKFGTYSGDKGDDLMFGRSIGDTVAGRILLRTDGNSLLSAQCRLGGRDCLFGTEFLDPPFPVGPSGTIDFTGSFFTFSQFEIAGTSGVFRFGTDYTDDPDGIHYYQDVEFDLNNVERTVAAVPLPASAGFLLFAVGGVGLLALRRNRKS